VRVDRRGRFHYRWRPRRAGRYEIYAVYRSQRRNLASNETYCPLRFAVG
jgi:hypothetical protein